MIIQFAKVKSVDAARVVVDMKGAGGSCVFEALLMQTCGVSGPSVWMPPSVGDVVVVAFDEERPENSIVLGVVFPDGKTPPKTGSHEIALQGNVYIGDDVSNVQSCPREDRLQSQLNDIKAEFDALSIAFNEHTHGAALFVEGTAEGPVVTGTATGSTSAPHIAHSNTYAVASTASDSVWVK